ncbi:unnamed protein product [Mytilus coruscus]|uniref:Reverse transcriptase domain-containing protein n=1 Tax=Mytilus coruscus TaxID=42192 RepID=A0A6J8EDM7_MYTCO|nr:unnamed protein product [Mytilus coruscus]
MLDLQLMTTEPEKISQMSELNEPISSKEILVAVERAKLRKTTGFDEIPAEVLKNPTAIDLLHLICNGCFELGKVSDQWTKGIINPIFKSGSDTRNNPLNYRRITLISVPKRSLSSKPGSYDYTTFSGLGRRREELPTHYTVVHDPPSKRKEFKGTHINPLSKGDQSPDETAKLEEPLL